ncbi:hypothetical protein A6X21_04830 [Planctopirus hydrillae]|uniref:Uncharacterized protein n=1 Tax=Planctopirus hydrillae TaxID=1841610 RepID=A0A1C3EP03_9PLAN|nr:hypothetical protein A6X21_04830 [Planctopirus hydrillae]
MGIGDLVKGLGELFQVSITKALPSRYRMTQIQQNSAVLTTISRTQAGGGVVDLTFRIPPLPHVTSSHSAEDERLS